MATYQDIQLLGLNEKEAKVYLACLALGPSPITKISPKAGIKRTTVYEVMDSLIHRQLISTSVKGVRKLFIAAEPEQLHAMIERQGTLLSSLMPELKALSLTTKTRPTIRMFEGEKELRHIYEDTIIEKKPIYAFVGVSDANPDLKNYLNSTYIKQRVKNDIKALVIAPDSPAAQEYRSTDAERLRKTKLIDQAKYPFSIEINIYGNKTAFISFNERELFGVIVESPEIAKTMKTIFDFFWEHTD